MQITFRGLTTIILAAVLLSCSRGNNEKSKQSLFDDSTVRAMYDARTNGDIEYIESFADSDQAAYRALYAKLMGSIIPERAPEELEYLLRDPIPYVRLYAAFAIGQIGDEESLEALDKAFKKATIPEIKAEMLEAIGKCADENAMRFLIEHNPNTSIEESGKMWGVYRGMLKGKLKEDHLEVVVAHLASSEEETRLAAAHTLSRQRDFELNTFEDELIEKANEETSNEVKAALGFAIGKTSKTKDFCLQVLRNDENVLTRTAALQIAPTTEEFVPFFEDALLAGSPLEAMSAVKKLKDLTSYTPSISIINSARSSSIAEVRSFIAAHLLSTDLNQGIQFYKEAWRDLSNPVKRSVLLSIWSDFPQGIDTLRKYIMVDGPFGTASTMAYLQGMELHPGWEDDFTDIAKKSISSGLLAQTFLFAEALLDSNKANALSLDELQSSLKNFEEPNMVEGYIALSNTIKENYGVEVEEPKLKYAPIDWAILQTLGENPTLIVYSKGRDYEIRLVPEDAPASCGYVVRYSESGNYDGTYFHRIVPGFVSQGGGSRGDGFGSGADLIRSEFSSLKYGSAVVGLASAGKDTESCQFFITHMPTPHLDGRYSIFGAMMNDVFQLESGARIDSVRIKI